MDPSPPDARLDGDERSLAELIVRLRRPRIQASRVRAQGLSEAGLDGTTMTDHVLHLSDDLSVHTVGDTDQGFLYEVRWRDEAVASFAVFADCFDYLVQVWPHHIVVPRE